MAKVTATTASNRRSRCVERRTRASRVACYTARVDILLFGATPQLQRWRRRAIYAAIDSGPGARAHRDQHERIVGHEPPGPPLTDGPHRRVADALLLGYMLYAALVIMVVVAGCAPTAQESNDPSSTPVASRGGAATSGAGGGLRDLPHRDDVRATLSGVQSAVAACGGGQHGQAMTRMIALGATGRVSRAEVYEGEFVGTAIGACIEHAALKARFPPFRNETFTVSFPFRI